MHLGFQWTGTGVVTERRTLTSPKNKDWKGWALKVATLGATLDVSVDEAMFKQIGEGQQVELAGRFEVRDSIPRLVATKLQAAKS
jgi:hypothetical protein